MDPRLQILGICLGVVATIVVYGTIRCRGTFKDPLTWSPVGPPWNQFLDGWGLTHLFFYMLLGYLYPAHLLFTMVLGIAWELVEMAFKDHPFYLTECQYQRAVPGEGYEHWWVGRWQHLVMNLQNLKINTLLATQFRQGSEMRWRL